MNARAVVLQVALAAVGLLAAFLVWQREPEGLPGEVTVLDVPRQALQRVRYEDATRSVELYRDAQDEKRLWVRLGGKPPAPPRELRGNETAENLFASLAPLKGTRTLGELDAKKLEELGLTGSPRKLALTVDGREHVLTLTSASEADWSSPYVRREDGRVFLLGPALLPELEGAATRLVDRRMHTFGPGDFDAFTLFQGENARAFVVRGKPPEPLTVAPRSAPEEPDELVRGWHERVWQLLPLDMLGRGEEPPGGAPETVFRVEYERGGKGVGHLAVARGAEGGFYARTEHTAGWVQLHSGVEPLATEAVTLASGR
jgi:hypothetical protein